MLISCPRVDVNLNARYAPGYSTAVPALCYRIPYPYSAVRQVPIGSSNLISAPELTAMLL